MRGIPGALLGVKATVGGLELRACGAKPLLNRSDTDVQVNLILSYGFCVRIAGAAAKRPQQF
jgi:hypothetical protein